jgi:uncharacterized protein (TIGR02757 family)
LNNRDKKLKVYLDRLFLKYKSKYSSDDPVWILNKLKNPENAEITAFIISCYCYGQISQIKFITETFLKSINYNVLRFVSEYKSSRDFKFIKGFNYRFNNDKDFECLILNIQNCILKYGSLKRLFLKYYSTKDENIINSLIYFSTELNKIKVKGTKNFSYLIPNPEQGSTCKRLNLFLRWMVRKDEIDLGLWNREVHTLKLIIPVDTHVFRISRKLKLVERKSCDLKYAVELTNKLKQFDPNDPVKYDFALCHSEIEK